MDSAIVERNQEVATAKARRHKPPEYFARKLSGVGRRGFDGLCKAICAKCAPSDPREEWPCQTLAYYLELLRTAEVKFSDGEKVDLRSLDSHDSALGELTWLDVQKIQE